MGAAGSMPHGSPHCTGSSPSSPDPSAVEPICPDPIAYLPPYVSDVRLAQPFSASSSTLLGRIPTAQELEEELQGQARMAAKVQEAENKKASKARSREGVRGQWWPCETTDAELRELQNEGMISEHWSFTRDSDVPKPDADERVMTKAWVERGLSLPCSEFFLSVLDTYGLQPHNICPNSYLLLSNFATLCEGHLGIRPDIKLWQFFFRVKKETKDKAMLNCGSMTFMLRSGRMYPPHDSHESVRYWIAGWFYVKNASVPSVHDGLPPFSNTPPEELASWSFIPTLAQTPILEKAARRISWLVHDGLTGAQLTLSWFTRRIQPLRYNARLMCAYTGADDLLRVTRHDLPADSLKRRFKTLVKIARGQQVPELIKDISTHDKCPPLDSLVEENLRAILRVPVSGDSVEEDPEDPEEEEERVPRKAAPRPTKRSRAKVSGSDAGGSGEASAKKPRVIKPPPLDSRKAERQRLKMLSTAGKPSRASSSLAAASSELETLRASQKNLEAKLAVAEQKISEKNSELARKTGEFELKRQTDSDTIQKQQKEIGGLRKYMETAESCWDLLNSDVMDPLGYDEERRSQFPRDDLLQLAGEDCKDLISASRKICHNLNIKKSRTCDVRKLIKRMDLLPELVVDLQSSSARGAAAMSLAMCLAHNPSLNLDRVTSGVPPECDVNALLDAVSGYDTRIARRIRHDEFYEKVVLPADEPLEAELLEDREAENKPAQSGSQYTWTSSKNQGGAASPTAAGAEEDEDVSSPAKDAEKEAPTDAGGADANVETSPVKEK
ncbi:hypothetical protein QYE76_067926 [Lolium multiflorum]|uniref:Transposase (putative) gypsy type domain-containing protein n=1 Tax=Lolium multiflorum TaxID=4521 RepID=A0AAD8SDB3_LOLMU|nr:hypothetical protein QYE76_067926 [Lolium multiflorum]